MAQQNVPRTACAKHSVLWLRDKHYLWDVEMDFKPCRKGCPPTLLPNSCPPPPHVEFSRVKPGSVSGTGAPVLPCYLLQPQPVLKGMICQILESIITEACALSVEKKVSILLGSHSWSLGHFWLAETQASTLLGESPDSTMRPEMRIPWQGFARE